MEFVNKYKTLIIITIVTIILVVARTLGISHFRSDARILAQPSVNHSVIISDKQLSIIAGDIMLLKLDRNESMKVDVQGIVISVSVDSVLEKRNLRKILTHKGPVVLLSSDKAVSARIWMILSQLGRRDVFILTDDPDNEVFKNTFRPDTLSKPETETIK
jgi:hypothetical protein